MSGTSEMDDIGSLPTGEGLPAGEAAAHAGDAPLARLSFVDLAGSAWAQFSNYDNVSVTWALGSGAFRRRGVAGGRGGGAGKRRAAGAPVVHGPGGQRMGAILKL